MATTSTTRERLTAREAESLWRAWKTERDLETRDRLVLSYAPMVHYIASRKVRELPAHCDVDDLVSCGLLGLIDAVGRFDPAKGATFEQYAWTRASGAIVDELRRQDWTTRSARRAGKRIEQAREAWYARHGSPPTDRDLAGELKMAVSEIRERLEDVDRADVVSLNAPARQFEDGASMEVGDLVVAPPGDHEPEGTTLAGEKAAIFREAFESLSLRERQALALVHVHEWQGAQIGALLGVSESRVSQILASARRRLREAVTSYEEAQEIAA